MESLSITVTTMPSGRLLRIFFSNALSSLVAQRDRSRHQNACTTVYLIMQAIPSSRAGIDMSLLVSALKFFIPLQRGPLVQLRFKPHGR